ncbi:unnamed protein product [Amaranthus hypochondriacus]
MELALSLGNSAGVVSNSVAYCMGSSSSSVVARSTVEKLEGDNDEDSMKNDDHDDDDRKENVISCLSSDPSPLQLELLPFSPVPRSTQSPPSLRFPWLADNLSSEPGSSGGPRSKPSEQKRRATMGPTKAEKGEEQSSPNSGTSSFMEFSLYRSKNNNGGKGVMIRRENGNNNSNSNNNNNNNSNILKNGSEEIIGIGIGIGIGMGGGGSDDEENGSSKKKLRLSKQQSAFLEQSFKEHHTLNPKQKLALAKQLNLRPRQIEVWFQNRRARTKLKQTEVDCEYLKNCCETLTEENRRLQKELQEFRALKTSQPFYMQLPATTLTMCPSCERVTPTSTSSVTVPAASSPGPATPSTFDPVVKPATTNGTTSQSTSEINLSLGNPTS